MRYLLPLLALSLTVACNQVVDEDQDGFPEEVDCDDSSAAIHPGAGEVCDGIDNDCDGAIDEDAGGGFTFFPDADGDGYGAYGDNVVACEAPEGYVSSALDCDDASADINPGAEEVCDDLDNDCNGYVDDDPTDGTTYYADWDGDGFGSENVYETACEAPEGYITDGGDCNDFDVSANPDATEVCDWIDNDCDGEVDGPDAVGAVEWYEDTDGDEYGNDEVVVVACFEPDGYTSADNPVDCDDGDWQVNPGMEEICNHGVDDDCSGDAPECGFNEGTYSSAEADYAITAGTGSDDLGQTTEMFDFDGDGYDDLLVGDQYYDGADSSDGAVYVFYAELTGDLTADDADVMITGTADGDYDYLGYNIQSAGDVDGDGTDDLLLGANDAEGGGAEAGAGYLFYGGTLTGDYEAADADLTVWGENDYDDLGDGLGSAGDLDGDGTSEFMFAAPDYDYLANGDYESSTGAVYLFYGSTTRYSGELDAESDADAIFRERDSYCYLGEEQALEGHGDLDGDGYDDLIIGSEAGLSDYGHVFVGYGSTTRYSGEYEVTDLDGWITGSETYGDFGRQVIVGDVDGDGYPDIVAGQYLDDTAYVILGGTTRLSGANPVSTTANTTLQDTAGYFGKAIEVGDFNGDGTGDLVVSDYDDFAAYVYYGAVASGTLAPEDADAVLVSSLGTSSYWGNEGSLSSGDHNADGYDDLFIGDDDAPGAFLFLGGGM